MLRFHKIFFAKNFSAQTFCTMKLFLYVLYCSILYRNNQIIFHHNNNHHKKCKYLQACQDRRATFTPLCVSVDGMLGSEAQVFC